MESGTTTMTLSMKNRDWLFGLGRKGESMDKVLDWIRENYGQTIAQAKFKGDMQAFESQSQ